MWALVRRLLFLLDAETAHRFTLWCLRVWSWWLDRFASVRPPEVAAFEWQGLRYPNPVGLAAGLDKGDVAVPAWFKLGFGFVEIGTITPRPQPGNPRPRLFRLSADQALVNRMGFNNHGAEVVAARLRALRQRPGPIWVNIGKNKDTPNERAADDYEAALRILFEVADVFVVNISSPNTPGLRDLQSEAVLRPLLDRVMTANRNCANEKNLRPRPVLLKIAPDLSREGIEAAVDAAASAGLAGIVATNTTIARPVPSSESGGMSGAPLLPIANAALQTAVARAGDRLWVVGVGGVVDSEAALSKRALGAKLVQIYSGFIFAGPRLIRAILAAWQREPSP